MRFEPVLENDPRRANGILQRVDARLKLLFTVGFVIAVVATPFGWWRPLGSLGLVLCFLIGISGVPPRLFLHRWLGFMVLFGFLVVMVAPGHPARRQFGMGPVIATILAKNSLAFLGMVLLASVTAWGDLLVGMRSLGVPSILTSTLQFMDRYLNVLADELDRMLTARKARSFRTRGVLSWSLLTGTIGMLLLRTFERAERVQSAMSARGWDGTMRTLADCSLRPIDR